MRYGVVILPDERWETGGARWRRAEELGFDHAWTYDHLTWRSLREAAWFGAVPTLAAASGITSRIRLGTLVASPNFRHPVPFAKELMSLDDLSGGRFTLGVGAGGSGFDASALGQQAWTPRERADHFEEFVELLDRLLRERAVSHIGRYYSANEARAIPGCIQQPRVPFAVAAEGPRGMRLVARHAACWVALDGRVSPELIEKLDVVCAREGRQPASLARLILLGFSERPLASLEAFRDVAGRYDEQGFTDLVFHWPRPGEPFEGDERVMEEVAAEIASEPS